jgi:hypothetical protein
MAWDQHPGMISFDMRPQAERHAGWYRFIAPPGLLGFSARARGELRAWVDGQSARVDFIRRHDDGTREFRVFTTRDAPGLAVVALRIAQDPGSYGGAALPEPLALTCAGGRLVPGDWSKAGVLAAYSGGAWYRTQIVLGTERAAGQVTLDLGGVAGSAEVHVNGRRAGVRFAPPWRVEISDFIRPGENQIGILVYNTLANHYLTVPTRYRGALESGLLGPVRIETRVPTRLSSPPNP